MVNSKQKGNRGEREVVQLLREWWGDESFQRNLESGATSTLLSYRNAPEHVIAALSGDIMTPANFMFSVESKNYESVDLFAILRNPGKSDVESWWGQCKNDAERAKKQPMLFFKYKRGPWFVCISFELMEKIQASLGIKALPFISVNDEFSILMWKEFSELVDKEIIDVIMTGRGIAYG